jgi:hypothetical protein
MRCALLRAFSLERGEAGHPFGVGKGVQAGDGRQGPTTREVETAAPPLVLRRISGRAREGVWDRSRARPSRT